MRSSFQQAQGVHTEDHRKTQLYLQHSKASKLPGQNKGDGMTGAPFVVPGGTSDMFGYDWLHNLRAPVRNESAEPFVTKPCEECQDSDDTASGPWQWSFLGRCGGCTPTKLACLQRQTSTALEKSFRARAECKTHLCHSLVT